MLICIRIDDSDETEASIPVIYNDVQPMVKHQPPSYQEHRQSTVGGNAPFSKELKSAMKKLHYVASEKEVGRASKPRRSYPRSGVHDDAARIAREKHSESGMLSGEPGTSSQPTVYAELEKAVGRAAKGSGFYSRSQVDDDTAESLPEKTSATGMAGSEPGTSRFQTVEPEKEVGRVAKPSRSYSRAAVDDGPAWTVPEKTSGSEMFDGELGTSRRHTAPSRVVPSNSTAERPRDLGPNVMSTFKHLWDGGDID